jgi:cytochrome b561
MQKSSQKVDSKRSIDAISRFLHLGIAVTVCFQLLSALIMHGANGVFVWHKYVGVLAVIFIALYWIWILHFKRERLAHLFPWRRKQWPAIQEDACTLWHRKLPIRPEGGGLSGLVHGFGLILVSVVGFFGLLIFLTLPLRQTMPGVFHFVKNIHGALAPWLWLYIIGHVGMAYWHRRQEKQG